MFCPLRFVDATDLEDDEEDDVALATLIRRWQDTANVDQPLDAATFVTFDDDVPCSGDDCTTAVAVEENDDDDKDGNDEQPELQEHPSRAEVLKALDVLKNFCMVESMDTDLVDILKLSDKIFARNHIRQSDIRSFFSTELRKH